mmetsp:Transcript_26409/g.48305  ORF Transcript_26409/g.48305 Transcript_26409/m.48305 type:complete len:1043 (-) Transcript_26409:66-3194(-)
MSPNTGDQQIYRASSGRLLGVRESSQALAELKTKLEFALSRLNDQDTLRTGIEEIREFLQALYTDWFPMVISCISEAGANLKPLGRCESVKLMGMLAEIHGEAVVPLLPRILQVVMTRSQDADLHLREACAETVFRLTQALVVGPESATTFATLLKPLFGALGEHNKWVQIGAAACICSVIQGAPAIVIKENLGRLCSRLVQHLNLPLAMAKPQLLNACIYLMQAVEGPDFDEALPALMPSLESCLNATTDWQTRRQAIEVLQVLGDNSELGQSLDLLPSAKSPGSRPTPLQRKIAQMLEPAKVDKVRAVREAVKDVLLSWGISKPAAPSHAASVRSASPTGGSVTTWPDREGLFKSVPSTGSGRCSSPIHGHAGGMSERERPGESAVSTPSGGSSLRQRSLKAERDTAPDAGMTDVAVEKAARGAAVKAALSGAVLNSTKKPRPKKERQSIFNGPANANFFRREAGGEAGDDGFFEDGLDEDADAIYDHDGPATKVSERMTPSNHSAGRAHAAQSDLLGDESPSAPSSLARVSVADGFDETLTVDTSGSALRGEESSPAHAAEESRSRDGTGRISGGADVRHARGAVDPQSLGPLVDSHASQSSRLLAARALSEDGRTVPAREEPSRSNAAGQISTARSRRQPDVTRQRQEASPDPATDREWQWDRVSGALAKAEQPPPMLELLDLRKQVVLLMEERHGGDKRTQERLQLVEATCERQSEALVEQHKRLDLQGKQLQLAEVQLKAQEQLLQQQDTRLRKQEQMLLDYEAQLHNQQLLLEQHEQQMKEREQMVEKHEQKLEQHSRALEGHQAILDVRGQAAELHDEAPSRDSRQQRFAEAQTALAGASNLWCPQDGSMRQVQRTSMQGMAEAISSSAVHGLGRASAGEAGMHHLAPAALLSHAGVKAGGVLWDSIVALCDERRYLEAYKQVIAEPEESCLLRLMQHTGPVVDKLDAESNSRLVRRLIHILSSPAKEPLSANAEFIFLWLKQALDVGIHFTTSQVEDLATALQKVAAANSPLTPAERADAQRLHLRVAALRRG